MRTLTAAAVAVIMTSCQSAMAEPADAQRCYDRRDAIAHLWERHGEVVTARTVTAAGELLELAQNAETGSWTLFATTPIGCTFQMRSGHDWQPVETVMQPGKGT